jgi:hypothetical protein
LEWLIVDWTVVRGLPPGITINILEASSKSLIGLIHQEHTQLGLAYLNVPRRNVLNLYIVMKGPFKWWLIGVTLSCVGLSLVSNEIVDSVFLRALIGFIFGVGLSLLMVSGRIHVPELSKPIAAFGSLLLALAIVVFDLASMRFGFNTLVLAGAIGGGIYFATVSMN